MLAPAHERRSSKRRETKKEGGKMKLFIVYTSHDDYDECNPYIVVAEDKIQAEKLVRSSEEFQYDKLERLKKTGQASWIKGWKRPDLPSEIEEIKEVLLDKAKVVWVNKNPG